MDEQIIVAQILSSFPTGSVLHVGGKPDILHRLRSAGRTAEIAPDGLGDFGPATFDIVVSTGWLERLGPEQVSEAIAEMHRVARQAVYIRIATRGAGGATADTRYGWEARLLAAGFRRHSAFYRLNSYDTLDDEPAEAVIVAEKAADRPAIPGSIDREMDAKGATYDLAATFVRPGDTVLDLGGNQNNGSNPLGRNSPAKRIVNVEAQPGALAEFAAGDLQMVIACDALGRGGDDAALLREIRRVLIPGGRLFLSTSREFFAPTALVDLLSPHFLPECLYELNVEAPRSLRQISWSQAAAATGDRLIATAVRDPLDASVAYRETVFANLADARHASTDYTRWYANPWIVHSMVHVGYRVKCGKLLIDLADRVLASSAAGTADEGAALCILAYRALAGDTLPNQNPETLQHRISTYLGLPSDNPHVRRWQISLTYAVAQLRLRAGAMGEARQWFHKCTEMDPFSFSVHLATKTAEAFFWAGWLALQEGIPDEALRTWNGGLDFGHRLLQHTLDEVLINPADPNRFDHGDGMREFVHAIESITRCANGVHLLMRQREGYSVDWARVHDTFRQKTESVAGELYEAQQKAAVLTAELESPRKVLAERTAELDVTRRDLAERTAALNSAARDLADRTAALDEVRKELVDRTGDLDAVRRELSERTKALDANRKELVDRTGDLDAVRRELVGRTQEVDIARRDLAERTAQLESSSQELAHLRRRSRGLIGILRQVAGRIVNL
jgi:hypothetical protein